MNLKQDPTFPWSLTSVSLSLEAQTELTKRYGIFSESLPEKENYTELTLKGRVTYCESKFLEALVLSRSQPGKAVDAIGEVVKSFSASDTNHPVKYEMVDATLWTNCQRVTKGLLLE